MAEQTYTLSPCVVELLDRAAVALIGEWRAMDIDESLNRDEILALAAALLAEVVRRDEQLLKELVVTAEDGSWIHPPM